MIVYTIIAPDHPIFRPPARPYRYRSTFAPSFLSDARSAFRVVDVVPPARETVFCPLLPPDLPSPLSPGSSLPSSSSSYSSCRVHAPAPLASRLTVVSHHPHAHAILQSDPGLYAVCPRAVSSCCVCHPCNARPDILPRALLQPVPRRGTYTDRPRESCAPSSCAGRAASARARAGPSRPAALHAERRGGLGAARARVLKAVGCML